MVRAERLTAEQNGISLESQYAMMQQLLSIFCGITVDNPVRPSYSEAMQLHAEGIRPELKAIDAQLRLADAREKALNAAIRAITCLRI